MSVERLAAVSVDLDSIAHYCRIQGLSPESLDERARQLVYSVAVPRFLELFSKAQIPATFFAIASEADPALKHASDNGVEIASHSFSHDYRLSRWSLADIKADLQKAHETLTQCTGKAPVGFRAPGYTLSPALLQAIVEQGYAYDSSVFPAAPYWAAKAAVMGALTILGRPSKAVLDSPSVLAAPRGPFYPGESAPYRRGNLRLLELPISVTPGLRVPFIGTFATSAPWFWVESAFRSLKQEPLFNFELHAIDVLDVSDGAPPELARQQRDLWVPAAQKISRISELFHRLKDSFECVTLAQASRKLTVQ